MKVLVVVRAIAFSSAKGGLERSAGAQVAALARESDVAVHVVTAHCDGEPPADVRLDVVPFWPSHAPRLIFGLRYTLWCRAVARMLARSSRAWDVAHFHGAAVGVLPVLSKMQCETRFATVHNPHGMEEFTSAGLAREITRRPLRRLGRKGAQLADVVIATDDSLVSAVRLHLQVDAQKIRTIVNAVDVEQLLARYARTEYTYGKVVSVGRMVPNKGYDLLVEALGKVVQEHPEITWVHFGSGPTAARVAAHAEVLNLRYENLSNAPDEILFEQLADAHVFVQPSRYEGSSLTTLEAMSLGCAVVATPVGGMVDKVIDGHTGYLAEEVSSESLAEALRRALGANRITTGDAAQQFVGARFGRRPEAEAYLGLYRKLTGV